MDCWGERIIVISCMVTYLYILRRLAKPELRRAFQLFPIQNFGDKVWFGDEDIVLAVHVKPADYGQERICCLEPVRFRASGC